MTRLMVIGAHAADFVWRAGGVIAVTTANEGVAQVIALSYGERGESGELWKEEGQTVERVKEIRHGEAERGLDDGEDLVAAEVARRQEHPVARDRLQHLVGLRQQASSLVHDRHRIDPNALLVKLILELCPRRRRCVRLASSRFVHGIDRR